MHNHLVATQVRGKHARPSPVSRQSKPHRLYGNEMKQGKLETRPLGQRVAEAESDRIHIDVMDGHFVRAQSFHGCSDRRVAATGNAAALRNAPDDLGSGLVSRGIFQSRFGFTLCALEGNNNLHCTVQWVKKRSASAWALPSTRQHRRG